MGRAKASRRVRGFLQMTNAAKGPKTREASRVVFSDFGPTPPVFGHRY